MDYHKVFGLTKDRLISAAMILYEIPFEKAEHIVELAMEGVDLPSTSLAEASILITNVGDRIIGRQKK
jgi:hypothetical protein